MCEIADACKAALRYTVQTMGVVSCVGAVFVLVPVISLVVIPIFTIKALLNWSEYKTGYRATLVDGKRERFGRVRDQDYRKWNGKEAILPERKSNSSQDWAKIDDDRVFIDSKVDMQWVFEETYLHGQEARVFMEQPSIDTPFQSSEDLDWLDREYTQRQAEDLFKSDLKILRMWSKALIPVVGIIWVLFTEAVFRMPRVTCPRDTRWKWSEAITFHRTALAKKLGRPR